MNYTLRSIILLILKIDLFNFQTKKALRDHLEKLSVFKQTYFL